MKPITDRLLQSSACSRRFLEGDSLNKIFRFILSRQNRDGGFRGRGAESDLHYTVFAMACLKAIDYPIPVFKVWKYVRSFGMGRKLDLVHLVCLFRLRSAFPMLGTTRRRFLKQLEKHRDQSTYGLFLKLLAEEGSMSDHDPVQVSPDAPTTQLAAALLVNRQKDKGIIDALMGRFSESGGFAPTDRIAEPDLLSTAAALFALVDAGANLDGIQQPCFKYAESLWRDSGGFAGHVADGFEDVEHTFYALLTIGSLIQSMAKNHGT